MKSQLTRLFWLGHIIKIVVLRNSHFTCNYAILKETKMIFFYVPSNIFPLFLYIENDESFLKCKFNMTYVWRLDWPKSYLIDIHVDQTLKVKNHEKSALIADQFAFIGSGLISILPILLVKDTWPLPSHWLAGSSPPPWLCIIRPNEGVEGGQEDTSVTVSTGTN